MKLWFCILFDIKSIILLGMHSYIYRNFHWRISIEIGRSKASLVCIVLLWFNIHNKRNSAKCLLNFCFSCFHFTWGWDFKPIGCRGLGESCVIPPLKYQTLGRYYHYCTPHQRRDDRRRQQQIWHHCDLCQAMSIMSWWPTGSKPHPHVKVGSTRKKNSPNWICKLSKR